MAPEVRICAQQEVLSGIRKGCKAIVSASKTFAAHGRKFAWDRASRNPGASQRHGGFLAETARDRAFREPRFAQAGSRRAFSQPFTIDLKPAKSFSDSDGYET